MLQKHSPLTELRESTAHGDRNPLNIAKESIALANGNASRNTYIHSDPNELYRQAEQLGAHPHASNMPLFSVPISLKDCFDLAGAITTCGSKFYAEQLAPAAADSAIAASLRRSGALITGKSHLHPLAYGITGQNPDYGDCLQPRDASLLTGGSSSGAAASVQEGSALAAIGTDTGGSIRVPAALCGLVGYRASHQLASPAGSFPDAWTGAAHLAPSFDTVGFLLRDPRDIAPIAQALFAIPPGKVPASPRIGIVDQPFINDCETDVLIAFEAWKKKLTAMGAHIEIFDTTFCNGQMEIFTSIQAHEAAAIHRGYFNHFEPSIRDRLLWGECIAREELEMLHLRLNHFQTAMLQLFARFDLLMLPAAPASRLFANANHSDTRARILRYTTPFSMAGLPAVSLPGELIGAPFGTGIQIAAAPGHDPMLLGFAASIGAILAE